MLERVTALRFCAALWLWGQVKNAKAKDSDDEYSYSYSESEVEDICSLACFAKFCPRGVSQRFSSEGPLR
jgi:hypothetical protein